MNTVLDRNTVETTEKERHNAMISERYRRLLNAVDDQHSTEMPTFERESAYAPAYTVDAPAYVPVDNTPAVEQVPEVTAYTPSALAASVFTAEKFDRMAGYRERESFTPTFVAPAEPKTVVKPAVAVEASYSLSALAKAALAAFTATVVILLCFIGANTQTIQRKSVRLKNLEEKKQELMERNEEIQRHIAELQTEESIIERATEAGLLG